MITLREAYYSENIDLSSIKNIPYFSWLVSQLDFTNKHAFKNKMKAHEEALNFIRDKEIKRIVEELVALKDEWEKSSALERYEKFKEMESKRGELEAATQGRLSPFLEHALMLAIEDINSGVLDLNNLPSYEEIKAIVDVARKEREEEMSKKEPEPEWGPEHPRWTFGT